MELYLIFWKVIGIDNEVFVVLFFRRFILFCVFCFYVFCGFIDIVIILFVVILGSCECILVLVDIEFGVVELFRGGIVFVSWFLCWFVVCGKGVWEKVSDGDKCGVWCFYVDGCYCLIFLEKRKDCIELFVMIFYELGCFGI